MDDREMSDDELDEFLAAADQDILEALDRCKSPEQQEIDLQFLKIVCGPVALPDPEADR